MKQLRIRLAAAIEAIGQVKFKSASAFNIAVQISPLQAWTLSWLLVHLGQKLPEFRKGSEMAVRAIDVLSIAFQYPGRDFHPEAETLLTAARTC